MKRAPFAFSAGHRPGKGEITMKQWTALLLLLCLLPLAGGAEEAAGYTFTKRTVEAVYDTPTLKYTMETALVNGTKCYLTTVWMADPARQIKKAISPWRQSLEGAENLAKEIGGAALAINGSGYVSPRYPEIPENYPGASEDYYYTSLGSLMVLEGQVYRNLEGVPFYGLTLEADGLHMYVGADNETVLDRQPIHTWSFYEGCPMAEGGVDLLDHAWPFATRRAIRTIIAKLPEENTYLLLTATSIHGLTLVEANDFLLGEYGPEWVYNLDGGPSSALLARKQGKKTIRLLYGAGQRIVDVMGFVE